MKRQIPQGPDDLKCPLHRKAMSDVCQTCPLWTQVRGRNPQSQEEIDRWDCALAFLPMLLIENSAQQRSTAAAVETMTCEMQKTETQSAATINTLMGLINQTMHQAAATAAALAAANERLGLAAPANGAKQIAHQVVS